MRQRTPVALLVALVAATSTFAAGPYKVYRVGSAEAALAAPAPLVTVVSAGTVSDPVLGDGNNYYYFVRDGSGASLDLGMGSDQVAGTVLITFTGTGNLHDDALGSAYDLFGPAGVLATMEAAAGSSPVADALHEALMNGVNALDDLIAGTPDRDDNALKTWLDFCLRALEDAKEDPSPFTLEQIEAIENQIVELARALVTYRVELAIGHCGPCATPGSPVCQATSRLAQGNALRLTSASPSDVVDAYGAAINFALQAMDSCF